MSKDLGRLGQEADRATRASTEPASGLGPDGRVSTDAALKVEAKLIVAKLTEAQRRDIIDSTEGFFWTSDGRTLRGLLLRGVVEHSFRSRANWTPLGLEVRAILTGAA